MPIYEFVCEDCGHDFEELVRSLMDPAVPMCPKCGRPRARRKLSVFAPRMGSGSASGAARSAGCGRCGDPNGPCEI